MAAGHISHSLELDQIGGLLFTSASEGLIVVDRDGIVHVTNPSLEEMFGYAKEELIGQKVEMLIPDLQQERHVNHRKRFLENPVKGFKTFGADIRGKHKDGNAFPIQVSLNTFNYNGTTWIMAVLTQVPGRMTLLDELKKERKMAQIYLDTVNTLFVLIDQEGKIQLINKKGCEILGYKESEIIGKNWFKQFIPERIRDEISNVFHQLMQGKEVTYQEYQNHILTKEGEERLIEWNNVVMRNDKNEIIGTLSSGVDITDQKEAEIELMQLYTQLEERVASRTRALEDSQRVYKKIAENFPNGEISVLDKKLNYVFVEGKSIHDEEQDDNKLIGTSFISRLPAEHQEEINRQLNKVLLGDRSTFELELEDEIFLFSAVGLPNGKTGIQEVLLVSQAITPLKRAEEQMHLSLQKETNLNALKSRFVSMASHEFRTPLTSILNSTSLLSKYMGNGEATDKQQKHINRIKASVHHLTSILNDFLSLDKLEQGGLALRPTQFDIHDFTRNCKDDLEGIRGKDQTIRFQHQGKSELYLDKEVLKHICYNLMSNALKYSNPDGEVMFTTEMDDESLRITVEDHGIGIPKEEQIHLFQRFYRAKNAVNIQGTGLGLNIVKKYIDMIGGSISFESELNRGTTFRINIPLAEQQLKASQHEKENSFN